MMERTAGRSLRVDKVEGVCILLLLHCCSGCTEKNEITKENIAFYRNNMYLAKPAVLHIE